MTGDDGRAVCTISAYDNIPDIHWYYHVDAVFVPEEGDTVAACRSVCLMTEPSLSAHIRNRFPYDLYFNGGKLYLSADTVARHPELYDHLKAIAGRPQRQLPEGALTPEELSHLEKCGAITRRGDAYEWILTVHAGCPMSEVKHMTDGDWYV